MSEHIVDARTGQRVHRMMPAVVVHHARGSVRFTCACGAFHTWPTNPKPKKKIPEPWRDVRCACGTWHAR